MSSVHYLYVYFVGSRKSFRCCSDVPTGYLTLCGQLPVRIQTRAFTGIGPNKANQKAAFLEHGGGEAADFPFQGADTRPTILQNIDALEFASAVLWKTLTRQSAHKIQIHKVGPQHSKEAQRRPLADHQAKCYPSTPGLLTANPTALCYSRQARL